MKNKKVLIAAVGFFTIIVFCLFAVIVALITDGKDNTNTSQAAPNTTNIETPEPVSDTDKQLTDFIHAELKKKTNGDRERIVSIGEQYNKFVIELNGDDNFSAGAIKGNMLMNSLKVFEEVSGYGLSGNVVINWFMPLTDTYGNESNTNVLTVELSQETLSKINWTNFNWRDFENVADKYREHPALQ